MRLRLRAVTVAVAVFGVLAGGLVGTAALAAGSGALTGTVVDAEGAPVSDVSVEVFRVGGEEVAPVATDENGDYAITGLAVGEYRVWFNAAVNDQLLSEWFDGVEHASDAATVTVTDGGTTTASATLQPAGSISGVVRSDATLEGLADVEVTVFTGSPESLSWYASTTTDADGAYGLPGLWPGSYLLWFEPPSDHAAEWWLDAADAASATPVTVSTGEAVTGVDAELGEGGIVSGTVTDPDGVGVEGATVFFYPTGSTSTEFTATTDENGAYSESGLPADEYVVEFTPPVTRNLVSEWWANAASRAEATGIPLYGSAASGIDAQLAVGASIEGVVSDAFGGAADVPVYAFPANCSTSSYIPVVRTASDGSYLVPGLAAGSYRLRFGDDATTAYAPRWSGGTSCATSTPVAVDAAEAVSDVDAVLGETLSGSVVGVSSATLGGVSVHVYPPVGDEPDGEDPDAVRVSATTTTASNGTFTLRGLPRGTYTVGFGTTARPGHYLAEWWKNAASEQTATPISVTPGTTPTALAVTLALTPVALSTPKISGTPRVGVKLTAPAAPSGTAYTYRWSANGAAISGATSRTFTPKAAQRGKTLTVKVTASRTGYASTSKTSAPTAKVATGILTASVPTIAGTLKVGKKLTAKPGTWTSGTTFAYRWYANGTAISKATGATFTLTKAQKGKKITVKVTGSKSGYGTVPKTSKATAKIG